MDYAFKRFKIKITAGTLTNKLFVGDWNLLILCLKHDSKVEQAVVDKNNCRITTMKVILTEIFVKNTYYDSGIGAKLITITVNSKHDQAIISYNLFDNIKKHYHYGNLVCLVVTSKGHLGFSCLYF